MQKWLIVLGACLIILGLLWPLLSKLPLGRLPGDISVRGEHGSFFFPITSMILLSIVLTLLFNIFRR